MSPHSYRAEHAAERRQFCFDAVLLRHQLDHRQLRQVARGSPPGRGSGGDSGSVDVVVHEDAHSRRQADQTIARMEEQWEVEEEESVGRVALSLSKHLCLHSTNNHTNTNNETRTPDRAPAQEVW